MLSFMNLLLNILWFILLGFAMGLGWVLAGLLMFISVVGIPWGRACFTLAGFVFFPFGREAVARDVVTGKQDLGTGSLGLIGNVVWFIFGGLWLALGHFSSALALFITIIGIPFAIQHIKIGLLALAPIGMTVVDKEQKFTAQRR